MRVNSAKIRFLVLLICAAFCAVNVSNASAETKTLFTSTYKGEFSGWNIKMTRTLVARDDGSYEFTSVAKNLFATIRESSHFTLHENEPVPSTYEFYRNVFGRKAVETISFDWKTKQARYEHSAKSYKNADLPLDKSLSDPSLYQLFIQSDVFSGEKAPSARFIKRDQFKHYKFQLAGEDSIKLGKEKRKALLFKKIDDDSETHIWLIPELDFQIGRITHKDSDGETYAVELVEYRADSEALQDFYRKALTRKSRN